MHLTQSQRSQVQYQIWRQTSDSPSADFLRRAVVSYRRKYVHEVLVNRLGGLSLPGKSVVRLTDCPDMTIAIYHGYKTTTTTIEQVCMCLCEQSDCIPNMHTIIAPEIPSMTLKICKILEGANVITSRYHKVSDIDPVIVYKYLLLNSSIHMSN